jgi:hypothetical protein
VNLLNFDDAGYHCYQSLHKQQIVVTRNQQDFIKIPDLAVEDWTV